VHVRARAQMPAYFFIGSDIAALNGRVVSKMEIPSALRALCGASLSLSLSLSLFLFLVTDFY